jgi:uncharacterized protein with NAD-binding domain and iron-sulfur cluster
MAKQKIAILGGGVGAMTAALALSEGPNAGKYDITVYQLGWRLGGKGASGRNAAAGNRIEEHGLHIWFGFYYNALPLMQRCYAELTGDPQAWTRAFTPHHHVTLEEKVDGQWAHIEMPFPDRDRKVLHPRALIVALLEWMEGWIRHLHPDHAAVLEPVLVVVRAMRTAAALAGSIPVIGHDLEQAIEAHIDALQDALTRLAAGPHVIDRDLKRAWMALDLAAATVRGMIKDRVSRRGYDVIDNLDLRAWLAGHGATADTLDSAWIRALYSLAFAFVGGDTAQPQMGAGTALRCALRMLFGYEGAFMYKMQGGMGDVVFAPIYQVLRRRGVQFAFFHRVRALHPAAGGIGGITLGRQIALAPGRTEYDPLENGCWPSEPRYDQLDPHAVAQLQQLKATPGQYVNFESAWSSWGPAHETEVSLQRGVDYDQVVLGISIGALREVCRELIAASPFWKHMVDTVKTVRTQAFQLWLSATLAELWSLPSSVVGTYEPPLDTWADMSHLIAHEGWEAGEVNTIAYFCGVLADGADGDPPWYSTPQFALDRREEAFAAMTYFATHYLGPMWSRNPAAPNFAWPLLVDRSGANGEQRLRAQYWTANIDPSERYVLSVPGSLDARLPHPNLPAPGTGFDNLYVAGDWTRNGINAGCVEAAVMSGLMASRALSGAPASIIAESDLAVHG